jgi:3-hydroxymyristoyl/3-hydroxydecanoyl-(acyl carrier protein) dehydratase
MRGGLLLHHLQLEPGGWAARVRVPGGAAAFDGHFPDRPLLPGIAVLLMVADLAGEARGESEVLPVRLRGVCFRAPIGPGAALTVGLASDRFTVHVEDVLAAEGAITLAPLGNTIHAPAAWPAGAGAAPVLPHAGPARLVMRVQEGKALISIPSESPLARGGHVPSCVILEAAAQAATGVPSRGGETVRGGLLVRVAEASFPPVLLPVGASLEVRVEANGEAPPLRRFRARAELDGETAELVFAVMV